MALQQHFGNPRRAAEIAVDLEGRVGAEQVGIGAGPAAFVVESKVARGVEQVAQELVSAIAVAQPRPEADLPGQRPAGGGIAAAFE